MNKLIEAFKVFSYKLAQAEQEDRTNALKCLARLDSGKIKMIIASMCEVYINLADERINLAEAQRLMSLIEKDFNIEEGKRN